MKILILTSSTGGGHDMRARSLHEWLGKQASIHQTLEQTHGFYRFGVELYNQIQKRLPILHQAYFNCLETAGMFRSPRRLLGKQRFIKVLHKINPDIILSVHGSLNHGFFDLARKELPRVQCVTYCGELHGGYGFSKHWVNPNADLFIGAVQETCDEAVRLGMPLSKTWVGGFLLNPLFWSLSWSKNDREWFIRHELQFDPKKFILILSTGAVGANNHLQFLNALRRSQLDVQTVVLCGKSEKTLNKIRAWSTRHPAFPLRAFGHRQDMHHIISAASAIVARPGTGTTSESMLCGTPILFNTLGGAMPQEMITLKFASKHGFDSILRRPSDLPNIVQEFLAHPQKLSALRQSMQNACPQQNPRAIIEKIRTLLPCSPILTH